MAEEFCDWLQTAIEKYDHASDKPILIIGITGKSDLNGEKYGLIDQLLDYTVFCGRYKQDSLISIDAYFSEFHQIVFLCLSSYQDSHIQEKLFDSDKSFFEALNEAEHLFIEHLFILCVVSHLLVLLHPDTRGDTTILRHLMSVNEMRVQRRPQLQQKFEKLEDFSTIWQDEGRVALPRLLFIYRDNRPRSAYAKLTPDELNNSIDRLERTREFQIVHMLKKCQVVAEHLGIALASLTPHRVPFVHVLLADESESNVINNALSQLFRGNLTYNDIGSYLEHQTNVVLKKDKRLESTKFIMGHVKDIIKNESNLPYFFVLPSFKDFVSGAQEILKAATTDEIYSQNLIKNWLSEELHFIEDAISQMSFYAYELYNALILDERIGPMFYDPNLSEFRHFRALQYVSAFLKVTLNKSQLEIAWPKLLKQCNSRFKARRNQCVARSLSGARCCLLVHKLPAQYLPDQSMDEALRGRSFIHCSGYSYLSACSCGKTLKKRLDPFNAKEANYDFYSTLNCCSKVEYLPFNLYDPKIKWDVSQTKSITVKKRGRRDQKSAQLLSRNNNQDNPSDNNYTIVKPKSQSRIISEILWKYEQMKHEHKGKYLEHMPHSSITSDLLPLYPSWNVFHIGHSKLYIHSKGLTDQPGFIRGSEFLLPYDLNMTVKSEEYAKGMKEILRMDRLPWRERKIDENLIDKTHKEKLKFFIGVEYECVQGHRFMTEKPGQMLMHEKMRGNVTTDAADLIDSELPVLMPCKCSTEDMTVNAQLMRLHVVTPKAPISTILNPKIKFDDSGYFHLGTDAKLNWGRYYILRLPFVYDGPNGVVSKSTNGVMLSNWITINQKI